MADYPVKRLKRKSVWKGEQIPRPQQILSVLFHHVMTTCIRKIFYFKIAKDIKIPSLEIETWKPLFLGWSCQEITLESTFDKLASFFIFEDLIPLLLATFFMCQIHTWFWNWKKRGRNFQRKKEKIELLRLRISPCSQHLQGRFEAPRGQSGLGGGNSKCSLSWAGNCKSTCLFFQTSNVVTSANAFLFSIIPW